jgi:hypothetical protein
VRPYDQGMPEKPDGWDEAYREALFIRANRLAASLAGRHEYVPPRGFFQMPPPEKWPVLATDKNMRAALAYFRERQQRGIVHVGVTSDAPFDAEVPARAFLAREARSPLPGEGERVVVEPKALSIPARSALRQLEAYAGLTSGPPASSEDPALGTFSAPRVDLTVPGSPYMLRRVLGILGDLGREAEEVFPREGTTARALQRMREAAAEVGKDHVIYRWGVTGPTQHVMMTDARGRIIPRVPPVPNYYAQPPKRKEER